MYKTVLFLKTIPHPWILRLSQNTLGLSVLRRKTMAYFSARTFCYWLLCRVFGGFFCQQFPSAVLKRSLAVLKIVAQRAEEAVVDSRFAAQPTFAGRRRKKMKLMSTYVSLSSNNRGIFYYTDAHHSISVTWLMHTHTSQPLATQRNIISDSLLSHTHSYKLFYCSSQ